MEDGSDVLVMELSLFFDSWHVRTLSDYLRRMRSVVSLPLPDERAESAEVIGNRPRTRIREVQQTVLLEDRSDDRETGTDRYRRDSRCVCDSCSMIKHRASLISSVKYALVNRSKYRMMQVSFTEISNRRIS